MEIKNNFDNITDNVKEYVNLKSDSIKLTLAENLALFSSDILSGIIVFFFSITSLFFALLAIMILAARYIGFFYSSLIVCLILATIGFIIYLSRKHLFANIFVARFCKMFFNNNTNDEKSGLFKNKNH